MSILVVLAFAISLSGPATVHAEAIKARKNKSVVYQAVGSSASANMLKSLSDYNILVKNDTELEIVKAKGEEGTILYVTDREGALITRTALMAVDDEGRLKSFTEEDVARTTPDLSGEGATVNPFHDSLQIIFTVTFYAYRYGSDPYGIIQPQLAMFRYEDPNNLYTISRLVMNYDCHGFLGDFDGTTIDTGGAGLEDTYRYRITVSQTNPVRNASYCKEDPIDDDKAILLLLGGVGLHEIVYTLTGVRNSTGKQINITDYVMVDPYF